MLLRFPHLGEAIFQKIDNKSLASCQSVSGSWYRFIQHQKRPKWVRIKHLLVKNLETLSKEFHELPIYQGSLFNGSFVKMLFSAIHNKTICRSGTFLHFTALNGYFGLCQLTIQKIHKVEDRNPSNEWGETPLHYAAMYGHLDVCELIIQSVDEKNPKNNEGNTPLHQAAGHGHVDVCKLIIKNIDDKNPKDGRMAYTPFYEAARLGHFKVCKFLIEHSTEKNPCNSHGESALYAAATGDSLYAAEYAAASGDFFEICKLILKNTDDKNPRNIRRNADDLTDRGTALHGAAARGHTSIFRLIMDYVEDKNPKDSNGVTPLHRAAESCHLDICKLILENPSVKDKNPKCLKSWDREQGRNFKGETPLHLAAKGRHFEICKIIISYTKNKSPKRTDGKTPGQFAHKNCFGYYENMKSSQHYRQDSVCKLLGKDGDLCSSLHMDVQNNKSISKEDFMLRLNAAANQYSNIVPDGKRRKL